MPVAQRLVVAERAYRSVVDVCCAAAVDLLPCLHGSSEEYDFPLWPRNLPDVWRPHARMSDL